MVQAGWQVSALSPPTLGGTVSPRGSAAARESRPLARHGPAAPASGTPRWLLTLLPATERCHPAGAASCGRAQPAEGLQAGVGAEPVPPCLPPVCEPSPGCSRPSLCLCPPCRVSPCAPRAVPAARTGSPRGDTQTRVPQRCHPTPWHCWQRGSPRWWGVTQPRVSCSVPAALPAKPATGIPVFAPVGWVTLVFCTL